MRLSLISESLLLEKLGVEYKYSCVMAKMPKDISKFMMDWGKKNIKEEDVYYDEEDPSLGREDDCHITVKYGLHDNDPDCIKKLISDFGPVHIKFGKVSKFPSTKDKPYDVIKLSITGDKLHELNKLISDNTKCTDKYPVYRPHATIAYVKPGTCDNLLDNEDFIDLDVVFDSVVFSAEGEKTNLKITS